MNFKSSLHRLNSLALLDVFSNLVSDKLFQIGLSLQTKAFLFLSLQLGFRCLLLCLKSCNLRSSRILLGLGSGGFRSFLLCSGFGSVELCLDPRLLLLLTGLNSLLFGLFGFLSSFLGCGQFGHGFGMACL